MGEHGILFQDEMVRALRRPVGDPLRKTVTRRTSNVWAKRQVGDLLWVRECWAALPDRSVVVYRADHEEGWYPGAHLAPWRSSMVMPRWASRMTLRMVDVREEPSLGPDDRLLPEVDDDEARREGVADRNAYLKLFKEINGPLWPARIWRIEFEEVTRG